MPGSAQGDLLLRCSPGLYQSVQDVAPVPFEKVGILRPAQPPCRRIGRKRGISFKTWGIFNGQKKKAEGCLEGLASAEGQEQASFLGVLAMAKGQPEADSSQNDPLRAPRLNDRGGPYLSPGPGGDRLNLPGQG